MHILSYRKYVLYLQLGRKNCLTVSLNIFLHNIFWYLEIWTTAEMLSGQIQLWWSECSALHVWFLQQQDPTLNPWEGLKNTLITYFVSWVIWTTLTSSLRHVFLCLVLGSRMVLDRGNITPSHLTSFKIPQCLAYLSLTPVNAFLVLLIPASLQIPFPHSSPTFDFVKRWILPGSSVGPDLELPIGI